MIKTIAGRNMYRIDYTFKSLVGSNREFTKLVIADSFEQVLCEFSSDSTELISLSLVEDDISMVILEERKE
jgi:hypothetical protein